METGSLSVAAAEWVLTLLISLKFSALLGERNALSFRVESSLASLYPETQWIVRGGRR